MTRCTTVVISRDNREPSGNTGDVETVGRILDHQLVTARLGRREEDAVGRIGDVFLGPENAHELFELVVIGRDVREYAVEFLGPDRVETLVARGLARGLDLDLQVGDPSTAGDLTDARSHKHQDPRRNDDRLQGEPTDRR